MRTARISVAVLLLVGVPASALKTRIRDVSHPRGVRPSQLRGIGLVTGLSGRGDSRNSKLTRQAVANLLSHMGMESEPEEFRASNSALVVVTAEIPGFVRAGDRVDVTVSSLLDARSIEGGVLLQTPLLGANGETYAAAQGKVATGGKKSRRGSNVGRIPGGGIVERDVVSEFVKDGTVALCLLRNDFALAEAVRVKIREAFPETDPKVADSGLVSMKLPSAEDPAGFLARVGELEVEFAPSAKVVVDSRSGVVVVGGEVRVAPCAVSSGEVQVQVDGKDDFSSLVLSAGMPGSGGGGHVALLDGGTDVKGLVDSLNAMGLPTEDVIAVLRAVHRAGAMAGELVIQ